MFDTETKYIEGFEDICKKTQSLFSKRIFAWYA